MKAAERIHVDILLRVQGWVGQRTLKAVPLPLTVADEENEAKLNDKQNRSWQNRKFQKWKVFVQIWNRPPPKYDSAVVLKTEGAKVLTHSEH